MLPNREICGKPGRSVSTWVCGLPPDHVGPCALYDTEEHVARVFKGKPKEDIGLVIGDIYYDHSPVPSGGRAYAWNGREWVGQELGA